jgi:hypothetical protein
MMNVELCVTSLLRLIVKILDLRNGQLKRFGNH